MMTTSVSVMSIYICSVISGWSEARTRPGISRLRVRAEPVIGPRFARTRWHRPEMTLAVGYLIPKMRIGVSPRFFQLWCAAMVIVLPARAAEIPTGASRG